MYMYGADFHAACVGGAALEALAQCASLACGAGGNGGGIATGLGELEPGLIHWADGAAEHDGAGWTKVVAGPRNRHLQDTRQGSCPPPTPTSLHHNPFHILAAAPDLEPLPQCVQEVATLHQRTGNTKGKDNGGGRNKKQSKSKRKVGRAAQRRRCRGHHVNHRSTKPPPPPAVLTDKTSHIFVYGPAQQAHTLHLRCSDLVADLKDALQGIGYDLGVDRLCRLGGAPLPRDDCLTLAESGLHANSSVQVVGRLRGGVEVTLFGQLGDTGLLDLKGNDVGPAKLKEVAELFSSPESLAVRRLVLSGNMITGSMYDADKDISGVTTLFDTLKTSSVTELGLAKCGLGPGSLDKLAEYVREATAAVNSVNVDGNPIGCPSSATLKPGAVTGLEVKKGVFAAVDGRFGEVTMDPDGGNDVKLLWLDDGSTSRYTKASKLTSVVASRSDLIEDYTHIRSLGEALSGSKVQTYGFANCKFNPVSLATFVESVRWADAAVVHIALGSNPIGDEAMISFLDILKDIPLISFDISNTRCGVSTASKLAELLSEETKFKAAVASLRCGNNPGMVGKLDEYGCLEPPDAYAEVFKELTDSLKTSQVTEADFSCCGIGPVALGHLGEWVREARAAVNSVTVDGNPIGGPSGVCVKSGAVTGVDVKTGAFGSKNGRFAEILEDPNSDDEDDSVVDIRWLDTGEEDCIETSELTSVVASRADLIEDYSHIRSLGEAFSGSKVHTYGLANCNFNPATLTTFVESVRWAEAVLASVNLSGNPLTGAIQNFHKSGFPWENIDSDMAGFIALCSVLGKLTKVNLSDCHLGPASAAELAKVFSDADAALTSMNCLNNPLGEGVHTIIKVFEETPRLRTLCGLEEGVEQIDWSNSKKGPADVALLAAELNAGRAVAALTSINCLANQFGEEDLATLLTAIEGTSVRSLCGLTEGQTTADFSGQNLRPIDMKIMAAEYGFQGFIAAIARIDLSGESTHHRMYPHRKHARQSL
eukprot:COSAG02_NODE_1847_length_10681_cov_21.865904_5_plen_992_part_00